MSESKDKEITGNPAIGRKPPSNVKDLSPLLRGSRSFDDYSSTSDEYIKEMTKAFNQRFVVEGGKCKCSEGTKEASIKATRVTSTTFGKACALTFSCTKMMEEEIFGKCRKLTFEKADKEGKAVLDISPVMCEGHYNPKPNKWKDPASTVGDNGEDIILLTSTLKCEHGGRITITSNGQGGKLKESLGNMWFDQAVRGSYSEYDTIGGEILGGLMRINLWFNLFATGRDFQHGYYNLDGDEMASALLGAIPTFKAISLSGTLPKLKDLKKLFKKDGSKKAEGRAVVEKANSVESGFGELMSPSESARYDQYWGRKASQVGTPGSSYYHYREYNGIIEKSKVIYDEFGRQTIRIDFSDHGMPFDHSIPHIHEYLYGPGLSPSNGLEFRYNY